MHQWSKVDKLKNVLYPVNTFLFSIIHLWSDQPKHILISGVNRACVTTKWAHECIQIHFWMGKNTKCAELGTGTPGPGLGTTALKC